MLLEAFRDGDERPNEHSRIPSITSAVEVLQGLVEIRFFDELLRSEEIGFVRLGSLRWGQRFTHRDVAVAGRRFRRLDADGYDCLAAAGEVKCVREDLLELPFFRDDVLGR